MVLIFEIIYISHMRYYHLLFITMCHIRPLSFLLIILGTEIFFMCKILFVTLYRITWVRVRVRIRIGYYKAMYIIYSRVRQINLLLIFNIYLLIIVIK